MIPTEKQKIALQYLTNITTEFCGYGGAAGGGKTYLGCYWLMQLCFYAPGTKYFIGRDSLKDTRESVLHTWRKLTKELNFTKWKYNDNHIYFENGSEIEFLDLSFFPQKDPLYERFGSKEYTAGWIEEAASVNYMAFEVLKTRIGRWRNEEYNIKKKILCTFNPRKTWVYTQFYKPFKENKLTDDTIFIPALATDNPFLDKDYIKTLENLKDKTTKERLLFGNFEYDDDPNWLIESYDTILDLFTNSFVKGGLKYIICDAARFGSDKAIIIVFDGMRAIEKYVFETSKTTDISTKIKELQKKYHIPNRQTLVDSDGVGGGVVDEVDCIGFVNNSVALKEKITQEGKEIKGKQIKKIPNFNNLKSQCGFKLAEYINSSNLYIGFQCSETEKDNIIQEIEILKRKDIEDKQSLISKEEMKILIGRSPDWLDTFIMRMYFELTNKKDWISF